MATKKRRTTRRKTARRTTSHAAANPAPRRRRRTTSAAATTHYSSSRPRRRNPSRRRSVRRRNPASGGMLSQGLELAAAAALVQFTLGFVPPIGGVSPLADAARTAGTGWLISTAMNKTGVARRYANSVALAGFTLAGGKLISSFILPFANRIFSRAPQQQSSNGMSGIALTTGIPPALVPAPQPAQQQRNGVNGIAAVPNRYGR